MENGQAVSAGIQCLMARRGWSARTTSLKAGLSESYVSKVITHEIAPSLRAFGKIAQALEMSPHEVWFLALSAAAD